jgi:hypothetical protein
MIGRWKCLSIVISDWPWTPFRNVGDIKTILFSDISHLVSFIVIFPLFLLLFLFCLSLFSNVDLLYLLVFILPFIFLYCFSFSSFLLLIFTVLTRIFVRLGPERYVNLACIFILRVSTPLNAFATAAVLKGLLSIRSYRAAQRNTCPSTLLWTVSLL